MGPRPGDRAKHRWTAYRLTAGAPNRKTRPKVRGCVGPGTACRSPAARAVGCPARAGDEDRLAVVPQLGNGLADVGQRSVPAVLLRRVEVGPRVPPASELLDRGDVDDPVVEVGLGSDRSRARKPRSVATVLPPSGAFPGSGTQARTYSRTAAWAWSRVVPRPARRAGRRRCACRGRTRVHLGQRLRRRGDDEVDALAQLVELVVGHERRHLDKGVSAQVEAGHLAVDHTCGPPEPARSGDPGEPASVGRSAHNGPAYSSRLR